MRKSILKITLIAGFIFQAIFINAQSTDKQWSVGLFAGKNEYNGDLGNSIFNFKKASYNFGALSLNRYLSKSFDLGIQGSYGDYGYYKNEIENFKSRKTEGILMLKYKLANGYIFKEEAKLAPYFAVGAGFAGYSGSRVVTGSSDMVLPVGGGVKYNISKAVAIQYQALYHFTNSDKRDRHVAKKNDSFLEHTLGIVFSFGGGSKDSDGDGIVDKLDKCPKVKGLTAFAGCPDTDGDGIQDSEDKCPTVKGLAQFNGCPDTDGDGIQDSEDKCPTVKGLAQFNGCPDTDGDGIQDSEDKCPTVKGLAQFNGCPDTDGDGIPDNLDKCPNVFGIKENKGCPAVKDEVKKVFEQALTGIQFESGKDVIKKTSYPILDNVVKIMKENPSYIIEINGHTDNQGDAAKNMTLSQNRADAVKKYISDKGVDVSRMTAKGFGITMPIADNKTAAGRAKNRRVEFKVIF